MTNRKNISMIEVTKGYETFIARKETNKHGQMLFNKVIKKASKTKKQRALK